ncbi:MAG: hypothetical protein JKY48_17935 [Flavobacteriales bacterium]|nr:hypothetical protein [Flavobacteriales bacterium]
MKKTLTLLSLIAIGLASSAQQAWRQAPLNDSANYYQVVQQESALIAPLRSKTDRKSKKQVKQFDRWMNFWKDRILPNGSFVNESQNAAVFNAEKKRNNKYLSSISTRKAAQWTAIGPFTPPNSTILFYPGMGRVNTIAISGSDTNTIYVGTPGGGVWKSSNAGGSWIALTDQLPNMGISDIVIDPSNSNIIYIATGDADGMQNRSLGVFKSIDAGLTWNPTGLQFNLVQNDIISNLLIDPNNTSILFATTKNNIKRSNDGGINWTNVYTAVNSFFNDIQYKEGSSTTLFTTDRSGNFLRSTNNGISWSSLNTPSSGRLDIALTPIDTGLIYLVDGFGSINISINDGTTWNMAGSISGYDSQGGYNTTIAVSPLNKDLVLVGGVEGWRSLDGGGTWQKYLDGYWTSGNPFFYVHSDHHDMQFVPGTNIAYSANDGGVFIGDASGSTPWRDLSPGLGITQYYNVDGTPQQPNFLLAGAQDNDIAQYNGTNFYGRNPGSDGVESLWDYSDTNIAWTCSQAGLLNRTTDGFNTSSSLTTPAGAPFVWRLEINPINPSSIYGGFSDLFKSTDRGDTWTNLNASVNNIESIKIAANDTNVIYVGGSNGLRKTINGGTSWTTVNIPATGTIKSVELHPTNNQIVYIVYSGYTANKIYKSINGGTTWSNITGQLPNIPSHKILYKTGTLTEELFLATDLGVYHWDIVTIDWNLLGVGLPNVIVNDIEINYAIDVLRAATFGRGLWQTPINTIGVGLETTELASNLVNTYPNPTTNKEFTLDLSQLSGESHVLIYNLIGSVVIEF